MRNNEFKILIRLWRVLEIGFSRRLFRFSIPRRYFSAAVVKWLPLCLLALRGKMWSENWMKKIKMQFGFARWKREGDRELLKSFQMRLNLNRIKIWVVKCSLFNQSVSFRLLQTTLQKSRRLRARKQFNYSSSIWRRKSWEIYAEAFFLANWKSELLNSGESKLNYDWERDNDHVIIYVVNEKNMLQAREKVVNKTSITIIP